VTSGDDSAFRPILEALDPKARDDLRRVLIRDQVDRDAIASDLLRYRDGRGDEWADIIDMLTLHPEARSSSHLVYAHPRHNPAAFVAQMEQAG
jgi:hypothetical protein